MGMHREKTSVAAYFQGLSDRLRRVRVCCGDWSRVMGESVTWRHGMTAILLDPPYDGEEDVYSTTSANIGADVRAWCLENGQNPLLRICLCGYAGSGNEVLEAAGWRVEAWKAAGGYGSQGDGHGRENCRRERLWFSPACINPRLDLFAADPAENPSA